MFWIEDPTPAEDQSAFRLIRQHTTTPDRGRRGVQQHLGLPTADHRAADRLHPHLGVPHRRHHPPAPNLRPRRPVRGPLRLARRRRPLPDRHGRRAARRPQHPELRHPGVHGSPRRRPARCSRTGYTLPRRATCTRATSPASASSFDEEAAARYPYDPNYLPVNRRRDGSMHDW